MVNHRKHATAWEIVKGAMGRWNATERVDHEGDAGLIVDGAVLEELEELASAVDKLALLPDAVTKLAQAVDDLAKQQKHCASPGSGISVHIGPKTAATILGTLALGVGGGAWWVGPIG